MAFKISPFASFHCILLIILLSLIPTSHSLFGEIFREGPREPHFLPYEPKDNSTLNLVDLEHLSKTLFQSGHKIMSLLLKRELLKIVPYGKIENSTKTLGLYDNNTVTVFAPRDEAFRLKPWTSLPYQVVVSRFDQESVKSGLVFKGLKMPTCEYYFEYVVVTEIGKADGSVSINNVKITDWNLYNDGHLMVHGVEDFFDIRFRA